METKEAPIKVVVGVNMPQQLKDELQAIARVERRSLSAQILFYCAQAVAPSSTDAGDASEDGGAS